MNKNLTDKQVKEILRAYKKAQDEIQDKVYKVFAKVSKKGKWDYVEMQKYNRYKSMFNQINEIIRELGGEEHKLLRDVLRNTYKEEYAHALSELEKIETGVKPNITYQDLKNAELNVNFSMLNTKQIDEMLLYPWSGASYSDRLWKNKDLLIRTLKEELTQSMILGESMNKATKRIRKRMGSGAYESERLARTEIMRASNTAHLKAYEENNIKLVEWIATEDERTCEICGPRDGKIYRIDNVPLIPAHPNCRCTVAAVK